MPTRIHTHTHLGFELLAVILKKIFRNLQSLAVVFICAGFAFVNIGMLLFGGRINKSSSGPNYASIMQVCL